MSEAHANTGGWSANPLLNGKSAAPSFMRTQWDEASARSFGPWRVAEKIEPTEGLTQALVSTETEPSDPPANADACAGEADSGAAESESPWSESALAALRAPVDAFFEAVMVNAEDAKVRANRYALLSRLRGLFLGVADISLLG